MRSSPRLPILAAAAAISLSIPAASAQVFKESLPETEGVGVVNRVGDQLPLDARFVNAGGREVALGEFFDGERPVLIVPAYYDCPVLCTLVLEHVQEALNDLRWTAGDEFRVLTYSFDHKDRPADAGTKQATVLAGYRAVVEEPDAAWAFLTTNASTAQRVSNALGFHYRYLVDVDEFSHAAALFFVTPTGMVSGYIKDLTYRPEEIRQGLADAADGEIGTILDRVLLTCFSYDPSSGTYTMQAVGMMRVAGSAMAVVLFGTIGVLFWQNARSADRRAAAASTERVAGPTVPDSVSEHRKDREVAG